jgi:ATP-binding cassette, subfamily C (CFTR/MRP), member 1
MQAIQNRVGITTKHMGSMKGIKMTGLSAKVQDQIQGLREFELEESKRFRYAQIYNVLVGKTFYSAYVHPIGFSSS